MLRHLVYLCIVLVTLSASACTQTPPPSDEFKGTAMEHAKTLDLQSGMAWFDNTGAVLTLEFFATGLDDATRKKIVEAHAVPADNKVPRVEVTVRFQSSNKIDGANVGEYYVQYFNFTGDNLKIGNMKGTDASMIEVEGTRGKGVISGHVKGATHVFNDDPTQNGTWDLTFRFNQ